MTTKAHSARRDRTAPLGRSCHPACIACGATHQGGLGLTFAEEPDGAVVARFPCDSGYQGYPDRLHGGVIAMLLDAAMVHCLFARGVCGVTAKLEIRFRHPVEVGSEATVRARVMTESPSLYVLRGEVYQQGQLRAEAKGLFAASDRPHWEEIATRDS